MFSPICGSASPSCSKSFMILFCVSVCPDSSNSLPILDSLTKSIHLLAQPTPKLARAWSIRSLGSFRYTMAKEAITATNQMMGSTNTTRNNTNTPPQSVQVGVVHFTIYKVGKERCDRWNKVITVLQHIFVHMIFVASVLKAIYFMFKINYMRGNLYQKKALLI